jgi:SNF2 family DNA or RNA helicase
VVCPTSVAHNWRREAARFLPELRVVVLERGPGRHAALRDLAACDLVVTSYALLRRDAEHWKHVELRAAILDEAQNVKNPDAAVTRAVLGLRARQRLVLTGTPLENRALDLWSLMSFANPGYLGTRKAFSARYDRLDAPGHARALLAAKLRPVLLRRMKREVAPELPDRIEERRDCELTPGQRKLYLAELRRSRALVERGASGRAEEARQRIAILAALTRLRQICCHPALAGGAFGLGSGKFEALFDLLEPLLAEGHKVLVFSQFVECLELVRRELARRRIAHHVLTGRTTRRESVVDAFARDTEPCVFLVSLKAGGTGLNLTAASYVILLDPWWNPAVEAQAIDRTHRIGQDRTVVAYRLVAAGTVEEKILELQERKAALVRDVLGEESLGRALTRDDLRYLFAEE